MDTLADLQTELNEINHVLAAPEGLPAASRAVILAALQARQADLQAQIAARSAPAEIRQRVTILFADLVGFTALAEKLDPEEAHDFLRQLWARLDQVIGQFGGQVDKHMGDGVMAVWGLRHPREDDPAQAIRAALTMQPALSDFCQYASLPALAMRVGVNTGLVSVAVIGAAEETNIIGDAVNVTARLEKAAPVGGVLISQATWEGARGLFAVQAQPPLTVKGKSDPLLTYLVVGETARDFGLTTRGLGGLSTRTIGRSAELTALQQAFLRASGGGGQQWVTVTGEAGVGKSRLLADFDRWLPSVPGGVTLLKGRAWPQAEFSPYALCRDWLSFYCRVDEQDTPTLAQGKLIAAFRAVLGQELGEEAAVFIGQLLGFGFREHPWVAHIVQDRPQIYGRSLVLLREFLTRLSAVRPLALLLEDLHWADAESLALLADLLVAPQSWRLCVVGLARPDFWQRPGNWVETADLPAIRHHWRLDLALLSPPIAAELARELLQNMARPPEWLITLLVERGGGNPYFMEELLRWLLDEGVITVTAQGWQAGAEPPPLVAVPGTVQGVFQSRLEQLAAAERATLQQAAVVGRVFWAEAVAYVGQEALPPPHWQALQQRAFVRRWPSSQLAGLTEYHFHHVLLRDVVYEYTLKKLRRVYHGRAAVWLAETAVAHPNEWAVMIARHYEQAEEAALAGEWYGRAGQRAQEMYAPDAAIGYYQKALTLLPDDAPREPQRMVWWQELGKVLRGQNRHAEAVAAFAAALAAATKLQDQAAQVRAWSNLSEMQGQQGALQVALDSAAAAETVARQLGHPAELARALAAKSWVFYRLGQAAQARVLSEEALALSTMQADRREMIESLITLGAAHWLLGRHDEFGRLAQQALALSRELGDRRYVGVLLNNLGANAYMQGDYEAAAALFGEALAAARAIGYRATERLALSNLGGALVGQERFETAVATLQQVIAMVGADRWYELPNTYRFLAEAYLGLGQTEAALHAAQSSLALAQEMGAQDLVGRAWRALGMALAEGERARQRPSGILPPEGTSAAACFAKSLEIFAGKKAESERARTLRAWAQQEAAQGNVAQGQALWQEAQGIFARLGLWREVERMGEGGE